MIRIGNVPTDPCVGRLVLCVASVERWLDYEGANLIDGLIWWTQSWVGGRIKSGKAVHGVTPCLHILFSDGSPSSASLIPPGEHPPLQVTCHLDVPLAKGMKPGNHGLRLRSHEPKQTFPFVDFFLSGTFSQWWRADWHISHGHIPSGE